MVTHQVHLVQDADQIVVMDHGRLIFKGNYAEITKHGGFDMANLAKKSSEEPEELDEDCVNDIVDMRFVSRLRSGSIISTGSVYSNHTVRIYFNIYRVFHCLIPCFIT